MRYFEILEADNLSPEQYVNAVKAALKQARWTEVHTPKPEPGQFTTEQQSSGTVVFSVAVSSNGQLTQQLLVNALDASRKSAEANSVTISDPSTVEGSDWVVDTTRGNIQQFTIG